MILFLMILDKNNVRNIFLNENVDHILLLLKNTVNFLSFRFVSIVLKFTFGHL